MSIVYCSTDHEDGLFAEVSAFFPGLRFVDRDPVSLLSSDSFCLFSATIFRHPGIIEFGPMGDQATTFSEFCT